MFVVGIMCLVESAYGSAERESQGKEGKTSMSANKKPGKVQKKSLTQALFEASTPAQKAAVNRRVNAYVKDRVEQGYDEVKVRAGLSAAVTKLGAKTKATPTAY